MNHIIQLCDLCKKQTEDSHGGFEIDIQEITPSESYRHHVGKKHRKPWLCEECFSFFRKLRSVIAEVLESRRDINEPEIIVRERMMPGVDTGTPKKTFKKFLLGKI